MAFPLPAGITLPSFGSGALGTITKIGAVATGVPVFIGLWNLFVLRMPPGHASVLVSWNRPIYVNRHQLDECVHGIVDGWTAPQCTHKKYVVHKQVKHSKYERAWYRHNFGIVLPKKEIVTYYRCSLKRKERCGCPHRMGKIYWEGTYLKWPWRRVHEIPLLQRDNQIVPLRVDSVDPVTGKLKQHYFEAAYYWRVMDDPRDDAPLRADHNFKVRDLDSIVQRRVRTATNRAEKNYSITALSKAKEPIWPDDSDNMKLIYTCVNDLVSEKLHQLGVFMYDFEVNDAVRTPETVLGEMLRVESGPPLSDPELQKKLAVIANRMLRPTGQVEPEQPIEPELPLDGEPAS